MTFNKFLGKKGIFAICTAGWFVYMLIGWISGLGTPFPYSLVLPAIILAWIVIILRFLIMYGLKSRRKVKQ